MFRRPYIDPEDWALFEKHEHPIRAKNYRICCLVAAFFMPAGFVLDIIDFGVDEMWRFLPVRLLSSAALLICWALLGLRMRVACVEIMGLVVAVPPIAAIGWMISETHGAESPYYAGLNLVTLGAGLLMRWRTRDSAIVSALTILTFFIASWEAGPIEDWSSVGNNVYFLAVNGFIVVIGTWVYVGIRFQEFQTNRQLALNREELKSLNDQLGEQNVQLKELDEAKSNFFANISHELRTPLTLLQAPIQHLLTHAGRLSLDQQRQQLRRMEVNASRLLGLINDLLDLAKVEAGKLELVWRPTDVKRFVSNLELSLRGAAEEKGLKLTTSVATGIGGAQFDSDKMERVCINLLVNALKFTSKGGQIDFAVDRVGEELRFRVKDSGMGMSPEHLEHVFDRFWQGDGSSNRRHQGTGIGLALVKEFTEAHGGRVTPESEIGVGTTFSVLIPYQPCELDPGTREHGHRGDQGVAIDWFRFIQGMPTARVHQEEGVELATESSGADKLPELTERATILIAEDEPDVREFLVDELKPYFNLVTCCDGEEAVKAALSSPPDVVLSDMMMPIKDGLQLCRELREADSTASVPIIVLTARADEQTRMACLGAGATDFLTKPFSSVELLVKLRNLSELSGRRKALQVEKARLEETLRQLQETESLLMRNEKLASLGRMSAGLIHEINNPLNYAKQGLLLLQAHSHEIEGSHGDECRETVNDVLEGVERVVQIVSDLRGFSRASTKLDEVVRLNQIVETTLRFFSHQWPTELKLSCNVGVNSVIIGSSGMVAQVLVNLIQNALDAMEEHGHSGDVPKLTITGGRRGDRVFLKVRDNGPGMSEDRLQLIFDPFFTTKDVGKGLGLGLAISHRIISDHKGTITVNSEVGKYCEFELEFPIAGEEVMI